MATLLFVVMSAFGAGALVWNIWNDRPRRAAFLVVAAPCVAILYWVLAVPRFPGSVAYLINSTALLWLAILIPGGAGALLVESRKTQWTLALGFSLAMVLWLPLLIAGILMVCGLQPQCDL